MSRDDLPPENGPLPDGVVDLGDRGIWVIRTWTPEEADDVS